MESVLPNNVAASCVTEKSPAVSFHEAINSFFGGDANVLRQNGSVSIVIITDGPSLFMQYVDVTNKCTWRLLSNVQQCSCMQTLCVSFLITLSHLHWFDHGQQNIIVYHLKINRVVCSVSCCRQWYVWFSLPALYSIIVVSVAVLCVILVQRIHHRCQSWDLSFQFESAIIAMTNWQMMSKWTHSSVDDPFVCIFKLEVCSGMS